MSKVFGLQGYLTGKLGATVFAVRNGEQIARQYNPSPTNPKTAGQIENRAKLKLLSQLSAALQSVIAIPRDGMRSPRNGFTTANYPYTTYGSDAASLDLADVQLTKSAVGLAGFSADRGDGNGIAVVLDEDVSNMNDAVMYVVLRRTDANKVAVASSLLVNAAGDAGKFPAVLPMQEGDIAVCAYGIKYRTAAARIAFENLTAPAAQGVAKLYAKRVLTASDATLTETRGLYLASTETAAETSGVTRVNVQAVVSGEGTVRGAGRYEVGSVATLTAVPNSGYTFRGWYSDAAMTNQISTNTTLNLSVTSATTVYASFTAPNRTVAVSADPSNGGTVSGGATVENGTNVTVVATANSGYQFAGWYEGSSLVSSLASYTFAANADRNLVAKFEEVEGVVVTLLNAATSVIIDGQTLTNGSVYEGALGSAVSYNIKPEGKTSNEIWVSQDGIQFTSAATGQTGTVTIPVGTKAIRVSCEELSFG